LRGISLKESFFRILEYAGRQRQAASFYKAAVATIIANSSKGAAIGDYSVAGSFGM
jgi:hypothetical protein